MWNKRLRESLSFVDSRLERSSILSAKKLSLFTKLTTFAGNHDHIFDQNIYLWGSDFTWRAVLSTRTRCSFPFTASIAFLSSLNRYTQCIALIYGLFGWRWIEITSQVPRPSCELGNLTKRYLSGLQISLSIASQSPLNFHKLRLSRRRRWGLPSVKRNCSASFSFASGLSSTDCFTFSKHSWYLWERR